MKIYFASLAQLRTVRQRDEASKLVDLHDDIAELKSKFDSQKSLNPETLDIGFSIKTFTLAQTPE